MLSATLPKKDPEQSVRVIRECEPTNAYHTALKSGNLLIRNTVPASTSDPSQSAHIFEYAIWNLKNNTQTARKLVTDERNIADQIGKETGETIFKKPKLPKKDPAIINDLQNAYNLRWLAFLHEFSDNQTMLCTAFSNKHVEFDPNDEVRFYFIWDKLSRELYKTSHTYNAVKGEQCVSAMPNDQFFYETVQDCNDHDGLIRKTKVIEFKHTEKYKTDQQKLVNEISTLGFFNTLKFNPIAKIMAKYVGLGQEDLKESYGDPVKKRVQPTENKAAPLARRGSYSGR